MVDSSGLMVSEKPTFFPEKGDMQSMLILQFLLRLSSSCQIFAGSDKIPFQLSFFSRRYV